MTIDEVIKKQTEILRADFLSKYHHHARAHLFVLETVNEVLKAVKEEQLIWVNGLIEEGKGR